MEQLSTSKRRAWLTPIVAGTLLTLGVAAFPAPDFCRFFERWYLLGFILLPTVIALGPGRSILERILLLVPLTVFFFNSNMCTSPIVRADPSAVQKIKEVSNHLHSYAAAHPNTGYPETIAPMKCPCRARGYYSFQYKAERSKPNGIPDRYIVLAIPTRHSPYLRSFLITEEGSIFYTSEDRPATRTDTRLE